MEDRRHTINDKLYTSHGAKRFIGVPMMVNGQRALAYCTKEGIVGYTLLEELIRECYTRDLPEYKLDF